jgi:hypothetical protein
MGKSPYFIAGPDTFGNRKETLDLYNLWIGRLDFPIAGVVQGRTVQEALECAESYGEWIALPFDVGSGLEDSYQVKMFNRRYLVEKLRGRRIHLLGISSLEELGEYSGCSYVESMNTGLPVQLGLGGKSIVGYGEEKARDSRQYMDMKSLGPFGPKQLDLIIQNIWELRTVLDTLT